MNIVILSGCERGNSRTAQTAARIEECIRRMCPEAEIKQFDQRNVEAKHCTGCNACFFKGKCSLAKTDRMEELKEALLQSDMIFLISPVYFHQVSGTMKVFIDRLSYWTHLMRLVGKTAVTVSVSSNNGNDYVNFYLNKFMNSVGTIVLSNISLLLDEDTPEEVEEKITNGIDEAFRRIRMNDLKVNQNQEILFSVMGKRFKKLGQGAEYEFWHEQHYLEYATFQALWNDHYAAAKV